MNRKRGVTCNSDTQCSLKNGENNINLSYKKAIVILFILLCNIFIINM